MHPCMRDHTHTQTHTHTHTHTNTHTHTHTHTHTRERKREREREREGEREGGRGMQGEKLCEKEEKDKEKIQGDREVGAPERIFFVLEREPKIFP
jgi:hypothetical protein